ncbi:hypothetical protein L198_07496 [Cryptococcus wingfieldii CBS 7118]|uniref:Uncharacterized protein n=1 Tax=Cryptococcus wingfieldii CBS 7118 TaxID=1295528 RepID=A0A1E3IAS3_9TREE|nr:hypothetical protein L198_07496 [Cryptococcus wingfieldii CBS 7118]ODN85667.1 hypothetical protein L198_07496 [Cryptococcus wingfieldii CBS 7118]
MTAPAFVNGRHAVPELNENEKKGVQKYEARAQAESQLAKQDSPFFSNTDKPGEAT